MMEDYIPKLKKVGKILTSIDVKTLDAQEMDYIIEINELTEYFMEITEGNDEAKVPHLFFLRREKDD
jgi:hypothetical protein